MGVRRIGEAASITGQLVRSKILKEKERTIYLRNERSSLRIFFFSFVKFPWALNAFTRDEYASSSVAREIERERFGQGD